MFRVTPVCLVSVFVLSAQESPRSVDSGESRPAQEAKAATLIRSVEAREDLTGHPLPRFRHNLLVGCDRTRSRIVVRDTTARVVAEHVVAIPEAVKVLISDVSASSDGTIAVAGSAVGQSAQTSPFIAWLTSSGAMTRIVVTPGFGARRLLFDTDGSLWTVGREFDENLQDRSDYPLLRRYDRQGKLVQSMLPRTFFPTGRVGPADEAWLDIMGDQITIVSITAAQWVQLSRAGDVLGWGSWDGQKLREQGFVTGAAASRNGDICISLETSSLGQLLRLQKASGEWVPVDTTAVRNARQNLVLLGNDNGTLVARIKPPGALAWITIQ